MLSLVELWFVVGVALLAVVGLATVSDRVDGALTQLALVAFRRSVWAEGRHRKRRSRALQSVHATATYPAYASKTLLLSAMVGVAGSLVPALVVQRVLVLTIESGRALRESVHPELAFLVPIDVTAPSFGQLFVMLLASGITVGAGGAALTYHARWWHVAATARKRAVLIDESLARTIAFVYALSRSGMLFPEIVRTVAANRSAFGESAEEIGVVVKDMDLFGADLVTAMQRTAARSPSERFADFAENFANVLHSGQNVSAYLGEQYEQFQAERVANQERLLELFTAIGEAYVAGLVAGPLFFITILVVFGVLTGGMLEFLQLVVYLFLPLANGGFVLYLDSVAEPLASITAPARGGVASREIDVRRVGDPGTSSSPRPDGGEPSSARRTSPDEGGESGGGEPSSARRTSSAQRADGGAPSARYDLERNRRHLAAYRRIKQIRRALLDPFETVVRRPPTILAMAVPAAVLLFVARAWPMLVGTAAPTVAALDDLLLQSGLLVVGSFAAVHELHTRKLRRVEETVPDLLDRLASTNDAGMTFTESLRRVDRSDLGVLNVEVERLLADVNWGARTERALERFNERIGSTTVLRVTALLTNAMLASGHLGPVIRIAAEEAREDRRLARKRRQEMFMYVLIIYLSFVVFLGIAAALQAILIPAIPTTEEIGAVGASGADLPFAIAGSDAKAAYSLVLFHAAVVQAACSGFIAGQMAEGRIRDGAKHVAVMVLVAYGVFLVLL